VYFYSPGLPEPLTYDKRRLLPFVETMPAALGDTAPTDYFAGDSVRLFEVRGWRVAPLLCFEAVYPEYAREAVAAGAHLLVNLSNDAWFSGGAGPEQHFAMSALRTVELRRPMIRAANGGVSGAIAVDGSSIGFPIIRQKAVRVYEIPPPPRQITPATTYPHVVRMLAGACAFGALALAVARLRKSA
jgi:apolipoprotein N-acyltransferase